MQVPANHPRIEDITAKLELAELLVGRSNVPLVSLENLFTGAMSRAEEFIQTPLDSAQRARIWTVVSNRNLPALREHMFAVYADAILGGFSTEQTEEISREFRDTGVLSNQRFVRAFNFALQHGKVVVFDAVVAKSLTMGMKIAEDIFAGLETEGIVTVKK